MGWQKSRLHQFLQHMDPSCFLPNCLHSLLVTRAMGTCYLGFGSKAALKPSHPQCLISDCTSVCHHSCCVGSVVCGAVLKQITELCKLKYPQVNKKKKIFFNDPLSGAVLLGSMDIIEETVAWRSRGDGGEGDCALCLPPHVGPWAHTALPEPLQSAEISPGFLWTVCAKSDALWPLRGWHKYQNLHEVWGWELSSSRCQFPWAASAQAVKTQLSWSRGRGEVICWGDVGFRL